ncbi:MAG TPA: group I intron-associated PD-(D/E)XK endonuclease [Terriglobales bacterium]|nr:group I intron-associated PD-(D/E)XK endonuclease [Terriglobales bacterium]
MPDSRVLHQPSESHDNSAQKPKFDASRHGEVGELAFVLKSTSLGFNPSRPYGARLPYDFLLDCGGRVLRIQVKSVFMSRPGYQNRFHVSVCQTNRSGSVAYNVADIDFVVVYVAPFDTWYVLPVKVLLGRKGIYVYPDGKRRKNAGLYENYREAWHLLTTAPTPTLSSRPEPRP